MEAQDNCYFQSVLLRLQSFNNRRKYLIALLCFGLTMTTQAIKASSLDQAKQYIFEQNYTRAIPLLIEDGSAEAKFLLGRAYHFGNGVEANKKRALQLYLEADTAGFRGAKSLISRIYSDGSSPLKDYDSAVVWAMAGVKENDAESYQQMGSLYENGKGVIKNISMAIEFYEKATELDAKIILAPWKLGWLYSRKDSENEDASKAAKFYEIAHERGHPFASPNLGTLYSSGGKKLPKDKTKAIEWWAIAHAVLEDINEGGFARLIADAYFEGDGVIQDYGTAIRWYRSAWETGVVEAQIKLGRMYEAGLGTEKNITASHMWFNIASATGSEEAKREREVLESNMTNEQITVAHEAARVCVEKGLSQCNE